MSLHLPPSFESRIKSGELVDARGAAALLGYNEAHVRRLCRAKRIRHIKRGRDRRNAEYFFRVSDLRKWFKEVEVSTRPAKKPLRDF